MENITYQLIEKINKSETIVVAGHVNPDGDTVGACFAVALGLRKLGKNPKVLLKAYAEKFDYLPGGEFLAKKDEITQVDLFIALDCADKARLGSFADIFDAAKDTINIDHHISNTNFAKLNFVKTDASSTCEVLYTFLAMHGLIDQQVAAALYTGVLYDTGGFQHTSTTAKTHEIASALMSMGIPFSDIHHRLFTLHTEAQGKMLARVILDASFFAGGAGICSTLTKKMMEECGGTYQETDGIVEYLKNTKGVLISVFIYETAGGDTKVSMRSRTINVAEIAGQFGGGGHVKAAGFNVSETPAEIKNKIIALIEEKIHATRE